MKLIFDTETTGLPRFDLPLHNAAQPHIVQLGMVVLDDKDEVVNEAGLLVKPQGYVISPQMTAIHGVSQERAKKYGVKIGYVVKLFNDFAKGCQYMIGHNLKFDKFLIDCEIARINYPFKPFEGKVEFCTMLSTTSILGLKQKTGRPKWPKLSECYEHFFNETLVDAHDALTDVRACARVYKHLHSDKLTAIPKVPGPISPFSYP